MNLYLVNIKFYSHIDFWSVVEYLFEISSRDDPNTYEDVIVVYTYSFLFKLFYKHFYTWVHLFLMITNPSCIYS